MENKYLKQWQNELNICIRCAYCFEGCPIFKQLGWEADGARGKLVLAYGLLSNELEPSKYIADKIFQCSFCQDCETRCSANVRITDILTAARADLVNAGFKYDGHLDLLDKIKGSGNIFGEKFEAPVQDGDTPVLLGCRLLKRKEDSIKYLEILKKLGMKPKVVDETCCGMPFGVLGYKDDLKKQQEEFRERLPYKEFICMCTTCAFFIGKNYPDLKPKYVIKEIAERLPHYSPKKLGLNVTYHDPCNLARGMNMVNEPREILKQIGVEVVEFPTNGKQAECCGGGGGLLTTDNPLAEKLSEKRLHQAMDLGVDTLVTLCPTCEFNLGNIAERESNKIEVKNVLDLVWQALT
jgi:Fe-S oxidoreductase